MLSSIKTLPHLGYIALVLPGLEARPGRSAGRLFLNVGLQGPRTRIGAPNRTSPAGAFAATPAPEIGMPPSGRDAVVSFSTF